MDMFIQNSLLSINIDNLRATYKTIGERAEASNKPIKKVLDIGTATGHPLKSIIHCFKDAQVLGVDIDNNYIPACQKLFS